jgi:tetratricopeptide (TPR) repeat protein
LASPEEKRKLARQFFTRATQAEGKQNWEYAVEMWRNAVKLDPENQDFRLHLRQAQRQVYGNNGSGAKMASLRLRGFRSKAKKAASKEEWNQADNIAEEGLTVNPWDASLLAEVGRYCMERGFHNIAAINYKWAVDQEPENKEYLRNLGAALEAQAKYNEAIIIWDRIHKLDPMDSEARTKVTQLNAAQVMDRGGYEEAGDTRDVKKQGEPQSAYDAFDPGAKKEEVIGPGMSAEEDMKRAIRKNPEEVEAYVKLGQYYRTNKRYEEASELLQQALQVSGGDPTVREQFEDAELEKMEHNFELAKQAATADPEDDVAKENALALRDELVKRKIAVLNGRIETYPRDSKLKYELAKLLYQVKQHEKAIPHLQKASADQRLTADVGVLLAKCFISVKKPSLAVSNLTKAIPAINTHERPELFCEAHYLLGQLMEAKKDYAKAEEHYNEVIGVDYEFRDALQRLENLQSREDDDKESPE